MTLSKLESISIIIPVYNEEAGIESFHQELVSSLDQISLLTRIYYINDGSTDRTREFLDKIAEHDARAHVVELSRNFGHQAALTAGLDVAKGDAIITMDGDGQHPPSLIPEMVKLCESGYEVVQTQRISPNNPFSLKGMASKAFYRFINVLSDTSMPSDAADFRLLTREVVDALKSMRESHRFLRGMVSWMGFPTVILPYQETARIAGASKYSIKKMMRLAQEALFSFSIVPLRISLFVGLFFLLLAAGELMYVLSLWISGRQDSLVPGWSSLMIMLLIVGAFVMISLSIIGIYIGYIFQEVKNRPIYLVKDGKQDQEASFHSNNVEF